MKKNTIITFENKKIKIPFDILVDPTTAHELETVTNPFSKQKAGIPKFAVAVYDVIKGAESLHQYKTVEKGLAWFSRKFPKQYMVLLD